MTKFLTLLILFSAMLILPTQKTNAMKYITTEQFLESHISEMDLVQLCDSKSLEELNTDILEAVNSEASDEVDGYLRGIYKVPVKEEQTQGVIRSITGDIMLYKLYKRRGNNINEYSIKMYDKAVQVLRDVRAGKMILPIDKPDKEDLDNTGGSVLYSTSPQRFKDRFTGTLS